MKKKTFRKYSSTALSLLMAFSMVIGSAPMQAFAEGTQTESGGTAGASLDGLSVASSGNADQGGNTGSDILGDEDVASSGNANQGGSAGGGSTGGGSTKPVVEKVTLTYDANAGDDEVTGLPKSKTVEVGKTVTISNYRNMKREGYKIQGWSTDPNAESADSQFSRGSTHVLEDDLTLYAVWKEDNSAKLQQVLLKVAFKDSTGKTTLVGNEPEVHFEYSYEYQGEIYEGITENDAMFGAQAQVLEVLVDENGSTPTKVTLTAIGHETENVECYALMYLDSGWKQGDGMTFTYSVRDSFMVPSLSVNLYYKDKVESEKPETEVPEGAKIQEVVLKAVVPEVVDNGQNIYFDYSYEYQGKTYEGTTENMDALKVLVDEDGSAATNVTLTAKGYKTETAECYALEYLDPRTGQLVREDDFTFTYPVSAATGEVQVHFLYTVEQITTRDLDVRVAFTINEDGGYLNGVGESVSFEQFPADYELKYSYKTLDEDGETVTKSGTLTAADAEQVITKDINHWHWVISVDVPGDGVYLNLMQNIQDITLPGEGKWVLDKTIGLTDGDQGTLYVSADNNPVTPYLYNRYIRQFTVTYTDGVENEDVFADQTYDVKKGDSTPAFTGTPERSGYKFTGWSPAVAGSVTADAVYTAQWKKVETEDGNGGNEQPDVNDDDDDNDSYEEVPEEDVPLADRPVTELADEAVPLSGQPVVELLDEDVPLANVPKTDDSGEWGLLAALSSIGLVALFFSGRKKKEVV